MFNLITCFREGDLYEVQVLPIEIYYKGRANRNYHAIRDTFLEWSFESLAIFGSVKRFALILIKGDIPQYLIVTGIEEKKKQIRGLDHSLLMEGARSSALSSKALQL